LKSIQLLTDLTLKLLRRMIRFVITLAYAPALCLVIFCVLARRLRKHVPRVVWGPVPLLNLKYWSRAIQSMGYKSKTIVKDVYAINSPSDFDTVIIHNRNEVAALLESYFVFLRCLCCFDIFIFFFDGGFLASTPMAFLECQILRMAGKKIIVLPYGSDIAVPEYLGHMRDSMVQVYPHFLTSALKIKRRVLYFSQWAHCVIRTLQWGYMPRYDLIWPTCLAIDVSMWQSSKDYSNANGQNGEEVIILHSSNHRPIKGTDVLIQAVQDLREEGLSVRLDLYEKRANQEVRDGVLNCDILAEQFLAGYGLAAVEGMSAGKPVLSNLSWLGDEFLESTCLKECPIFNTSLSSLKDNLRILVQDPGLRRELGTRSREFALKYHSYEAVGRALDAIIRHVWYGDQLEFENGLKESVSGVKNIDPLVSVTEVS
jgi:glycosyltransferase involved in cell wall biosynthesis